MRAVQIALFVVCIQVGMGLITASGLFGDRFYESEITNLEIPENASALSETEQAQASINVMNVVFDTLTWGWLTYYFEPFYSSDSTVQNFIDYLILFLNSVSAFVIGIAFIEFVRNRIQVLG